MKDELKKAASVFTRGGEEFADKFGAENARHEAHKVNKELEGH